MYDVQRDDAVEGGTGWQTIYSMQLQLLTHLYWECRQVMTAVITVVECIIELIKKESPVPVAAATFDWALRWIPSIPLPLSLPRFSNFKKLIKLILLKLRCSRCRSEFSHLYPLRGTTRCPSCDTKLHLDPRTLKKKIFYFWYFFNKLFKIFKFI